MHVGIVAQRENPRAAELAADVRGALRDAGVTVTLDASTASSLDADGAHVDTLGNCDLVVSIGGDGTFLFTARAVSPVPVMGVNLGEVGFLNVTSPDEAVEAVTAEAARFRQTSAPSLQELPQVNATVDGESVTALNEVAVVGDRRGHGRGIGHEVRIDDDLYASGHADGVLVATPTGSTAYNLSEDGPLVHPTVPGFVVTEMVGEEEMPPLVVDPDAEVTVRVEDCERAHVVGDGRSFIDVAPPDRVRICRAPDPVRIAGPPLDFFTALGKLD